MGGANVKKIEVLGELRAALLRFRSEASESLATMHNETVRTLEWLRSRQQYWQRELDRRRNEWAQDQRALDDRVRASKNNRSGGNCSEQAEAINKAKRAIREAEQELRTVEQFLKRVGEANERFQRERHRLASILNAELVQGASLLERSVATLTMYAGGGGGQHWQGGGQQQQTGNDQLPGSTRKNVPLNKIRYSQDDVFPKMRDGRTIDEVEEAMRNNGWDKTEDPPDMVDWGDEEFQTLDHRRLVAANRAGLTEVPANVHPAEEPLPPDQQARFQFKTTFTDPVTGKTYQAGTLPKTWGEAAMGRSANQGEGFPLRGSPTQPRVKGSPSKL